ncbi:tripartite tricarboxylate transporter TctB family protein [Ureibacillus endophyticus]|uniref:Cdk activating kinase (CAK)/RNA polymerase II transcription initiation/nucleotide excision repair factor TFIIH/TFIIK, cyclin H subunit n=1 Tax=Ureibacillus endophyticus TaxID=1978490 RepID=A0A494YY79_9BACL|nr:tripartite tricarboxylate transporter TctB family protein [Lysinibacillus endophyticus]RKQ14968.1 hypothetical protein D8M03_12885 [Lysinibacillus endophyticus]
MDRRNMLKQFVRKAQRSLNVEQMIPRIQYGILLGLALSTAILLVSRLFIFPYYRNVSVIAGVGAIVAVVFYIWFKRVRRKEALHRLDEFYPHNELVTALSLKEENNPLVQSLLQKAQKETPQAYDQFKKRKKELWKPKVLIGILLIGIVIGILSVFPSATQTEALVVEKEQEVIKDIKKEVAELEKKAKSKEVKKELQELQNKLKDIELSEEALREVVKKQKELKLKEQKLKEKKELANKNGADGSDGLTAEEQEQLKELMEMQSELASAANSTQSALSKLGKPISFDLQNAIASELGSESVEAPGESDGTSSEDENNSNQQGNNQNSNGQGNNGQGNGNGNGNGQGQGQGSGSQGNGQGNGIGSGKGGGSGAGIGQGSRDLLAVPERIGGSSETTADGGKLGEGTAAGEQKGSVPVTKGTIRPYEEVIGQYKDSYLESTERMQLPKDLQDIVQSYFSSIESNE